jgi:hypothetical protein
MEMKSMDQPVIGTLLDSFGAFGQFNLGAYYVTCFGVLSSNLKVSLPAEKPKETVDAVIQAIGLSEHSFEPVSKDWRVDEIKKADADIFDEYAYEFLFKSDARRTVIEIICHHHSLDVNFAYDIKDQDTETWILETSRQLQNTFKTTDKPKLVGSAGWMLT